MSKKALRTSIKTRLQQLGANEIARRSIGAARQLLAEPEYRQAEVVMVYLSLPTEADTTPLVLDAWRQRKRVLAPQIGWESRCMMPVQIRNLDTDVATNEYGVREPARGAPCPIELIDLVVVPGLGFDGTGNRLGRGRGFYDRFLGNAKFRGVACGFALEEQVVDGIPTNERDVPVSMLVTDTTVRRFGDVSS